jgi:tetratricopeptide (TPR) repeat protein
LKSFVFPALLAAAFLARGQQSELGQLDASPTLFTVMAAINSAGYDADLASPNNHPLRNAIRAEIAKRNVPSLVALKDFFKDHRKRDETAELSQYVSFALTASGPPDFAIRKREIEIPPDVLPLQQLPPLLAAFYREAGIADLWQRSQAAINQYIAIYHRPVSESVLLVNSYLRQQTSGFRGRHFQIFIDLQAAPNQIQTRSYGNDYFIVVTPSPEPRTFDIRHAYLHYSLDPLSTRYQEIWSRKKALADHAMRAAALPEPMKEDFLLLGTESLIRAIESRLDHKPENIEASLQQGLIFAPYFGERLPIYEKQEQAMLLYYPDLVGGIDLLKEEARLSKVDFNGRLMAKVVHGPPQPAPPAPPPLTGPAKTLDDAERLYSARDLEKAKKLYLDVLSQTDVKSMHAAAYYGLARIAALERDPESSERLFQKALDSGPEPPIRAWVLVYLGKLAGAAGEREQAAAYFQDALKLEGGSEMARKEARNGLDNLKPQH